MTRRAISYLRFSSAKQRKGHSVRRQEKALNAYVAANDLTLDTTHTFRDFAKSGFTGANRIKGALGHFLTAVRDSAYPPGSVLVIEGIDRLSRERMGDALETITAILSHGIEIVTLDRGHVYSKDTLNNEPNRIDDLIGEMKRAHGESVKKSEFLLEVHAELRENGVRLPSCPGWLVLNDDGVTYTERPEVVAAVRRAFELADAGVGAFSIAKTLNEEGRPTLTARATGWHKGPVHALLQNPAVIGQFQHTTRDETGRQKRVGDVKDDFYPAIIDPALFKRVNDAMVGRKGHGGRRGDITNLMSGILECAECGRGVSYFNTGNKAGRHWGYLRCDAAFRRTTDPVTGERICHNTAGIPHNPTQKALLDVLEQFGQLPSRLANEDASRKVNDLSHRITAERSAYDTEQTRLMDMMRKVDPTNDAMMNIVMGLGNDNNKRLKVIAGLEAELVEARTATTGEASIAAIKNLRGIAEGDPGDERTIARSKIVQALREVVDMGICGPDKSVALSVGGGHMWCLIRDRVAKVVILNNPDGTASIFRPDGSRLTLPLTEKVASDFASLRSSPEGRKRAAEFLQRMSST